MQDEFRAQKVCNMQKMCSLKETSSFVKTIRIWILVT
jgi:hypothetical protein